MQLLGVVIVCVQFALFTLCELLNEYVADCILLAVWHVAFVLLADIAPDHKFKFQLGRCSVVHCDASGESALARERQALLQGTASLAADVCPLANRCDRDDNGDGINDGNDDGDGNGSDIVI